MEPYRILAVLSDFPLKALTEPTRLRLPHKLSLVTLPPNFIQR